MAKQVSADDIQNIVGTEQNMEAVPTSSTIEQLQSNTRVGQCSEIKFKKIYQYYCVNIVK